MNNKEANAFTGLTYDARNKTIEQYPGYYIFRNQKDEVVIMIPHDEANENEKIVKIVLEIKNMYEGLKEFSEARANGTISEEEAWAKLQSIIARIEG